MLTSIVTILASIEQGTPPYLIMIFSIPLILASELGFLDIAEALLENKANINQKGFRGRLDFI